ncbi:hypothetical protein SEMRO_2640_G333410.1 [Seminavis robusta]|uniref:Uncharacterized protein n=1 Tax=Seminavis robusta TaxID=568900 RepID=A0A9N8EZA3_9STRA|nr:hypothetical protein SEMRO_2640_G333410.1 [Seminavis robusta]|eukprot:Sro2640_g333410.1 n/a (439) ;mRNA; r:5055-6371
MKLRSPSQAITVTHFGGTSVDFLADHIVNKVDYPSIRVWNPLTKYPSPTVGASLRATVLSIKRETKICFGNKTVLKLVLFDGSNNCFKAVTDTLLSETLPDVQKGCVLSIPEYSWIKLNSDSSFKFIRIMMISSFEAETAPTCEPMPVLLLDDPDENRIGRSAQAMLANTTSFHPDVVKRCHSTGQVVFTCAECLYDPKTNAGFVYCAPAKRWQLAGAAPVATRFLKPDFKKLFTTGLSDSDDDSTVMYCECQSKFNYTCCGRFTFSITMMDTDLLFDKMIAKVPVDKRVATCWDELDAPKKRWCVYHWIAPNLYDLTERTELPSCIVKYVREKIPNDNEQQSYTGYVPRFTHQSILSPLKAEADVAEDTIGDDDYGEPTTEEFEAYAKEMEEEAFSKGERDYWSVALEIAATYDEQNNAEGSADKKPEGSANKKESK